jgi:ParB family transcriptional regulator, chromosome partitioning protein
MAKPPSLGSRFSKNIEEAQQSAVKSAQQQVSPDKIVPSVFQPRRYFDPEALLELQESIQQLGILEPLVVRELGKDQYDLIAGERRWRCAKTLGLEKVPIVIVELSDEEAYLAALHDNSQREDLNPIDETEYILRLLGHWMKLDIDAVKSVLYKIRNQKARGSDSAEDDKVMETATKIISQVKKGLTPISFVETRLPLLKLPEDVLDAIRKGEIEYTKAKLVAKIKDPEERTKILAGAIEDKWSIREIQACIKPDEREKILDTPSAQISKTMKILKSSKVWEDPSKWKKIQSLLAKIEQELS